MPIMDENDVSLPKATLSKMIKEFMPSDLRLAGDATDMLIDCCTEFVSLVSSESNEVSSQEKRNTIHPEHVLRALKELGFQEFVPEVTATWEHWKQGNKCAHRTGSRKTAADAAGLTEEQQIELQQRLFAAARARSFQLPDQLVVTATSTSQAAAGQLPQTSNSNKGCGSPSAILSQFPPFPAVQQTKGPQPQPALPTSSGQSPHVDAGQAATVQDEPGVLPSMPGSGLVSSPSGMLPIRPLSPQPLPSAFQPPVEQTLPVSVSTPAGGPGLADFKSAPPTVSGHMGAFSQLSQQPFILLQPVDMPAADAQLNLEQSQLDWQQMNQPVVLVHNGTHNVVPLHTLLTHIAQASNPAVSTQAWSAAVAMPVGNPCQQETMAVPLPSTQTLQPFAAVSRGPTTPESKFSPGEPLQRDERPSSGQQAHAGKSEVWNVEPTSISELSSDTGPILLKPVPQRPVDMTGQYPPVPTFGRKQSQNVCTPEGCNPNLTPQLFPSSFVLASSDCNARSDGGASPDVARLGGQRNDPETKRKEEQGIPQDNMEQDEFNMEQSTPGNPKSVAGSVSQDEGTAEEDMES